MTATEVVVFPDAVAVSTLYLSACLVAGGDTETHVGSRVSSDSRQVVVTLVDTEVKSVVIQRSTLRVDCWVDTTLGQENAQDLGQLCRGLLGAMQGTVQAGATIYKVEDAGQGLADSPDPISGKMRYSFHVIVSMRGGATLDPSVLVSVPDWLFQGVLSVEAGTNVTVDDSDPQHPIVASTGGSGVTDADYLVGTAHAGLLAEIVVGASPGGELGGTWASPTVDATHSGSSHASVQAAAEATAAGALASHEADTTSVHGIANTANLETASGAQAKVDTHVNDATDAHDASAVSFVPAGTIAATDVQAAIEEVAAEAGISTESFVTIYDGETGWYTDQFAGTTGFVAYRRFNTAQTAGELYVYEIATEITTLIATDCSPKNQHSHNHEFSPDSARIAYTGNADKKVRIRNIDGSGLVETAAFASTTFVPLWVAWIDDGTLSVVCLAHTDVDGWGYYRIDPDDGTVTELFVIGNDLDGAVRWAWPQEAGVLVAYTFDDAVFVSDLAGAGATELTLAAPYLVGAADRGAWDGGPEWVVYRATDGRLVRVKYDNSEIHTVADASSQPVHPRFRNNLVVYTVSGLSSLGGQRQVLATPLLEQFPQGLSPTNDVQFFIFPEWAGADWIVSGLGIDPEYLDKVVLLPTLGAYVIDAAPVIDTAEFATEAFALDAAADAAAAVVDAAPGTLDTLNELAAALGDDANFATTVTTALAGKQPLDSDLTAIAALTTTSYGRAFLELANAAAGLTALGLDADLSTFSLPASTTISAFGASLVDDAAASNARTTLGLGTAATSASGDFQPIDSDLTAIAALTTTSFGRGLLELANAAAAIAALGLDADIATLSLPASTTISAFGASLIDDAAASNARTTLGLGTAATSNTGDFDAAGSAAAAQAASQPLDSDLTALAGLTATTDHIIQSVAGAWASRTPAQVRTALALVIGTNVQAWDADLDTIAGLTATTDNLIQSVAGVWASRTPAQLKATLALVKGDVGLGNVDNTTDAGKPVSTAQQTALDLKAPLASPALTGTPTAPTAAATDDSTQVATTAFVRSLPDVQTFTATGAGTWTKPAGCTVVQVTCWAGGGGGGGGGSNTGAAIRMGGSGGGGGAKSITLFAADDLGATEDLIVGAGGAGGAGGASGAIGANGSPGANSLFGLTTEANGLCGAGLGGGGRHGAITAVLGFGGGGGGTGVTGSGLQGGTGTAAVGSPGGPGQTKSIVSTVSAAGGSGGGGSGGTEKGCSAENGGGGGAGHDATPSTSGSGGNSYNGGAGGGCGTGATAVPALVAGSIGGRNKTYAPSGIAGGAAAGTDGASPTAGTAGIDGIGSYGGAGGGGGGGTIDANTSGATGGAGGLRGGGGGGGGCGTNTGGGGAGGAGGRGEIVVVAW